MNGILKFSGSLRVLRLFNFEHAVQGPFGRYSDMVRDFDHIGVFGECPDNALQRGLFHVRTDHVLPERIEGFIGIFLPHPVKDADLCSHNEFLF